MCRNVVTEMFPDRNGQTKMSLDRIGQTETAQTESAQIETTQTETGSQDRPDRNGRAESARPKSRVPVSSADAYQYLLQLAFLVSYFFHLYVTPC